MPTTNDTIAIQDAAAAIHDAAAQQREMKRILDRAIQEGRPFEEVRAMYLHLKEKYNAQPFVRPVE